MDTAKRITIAATADDTAIIDRELRALRATSPGATITDAIRSLIRRADPGEPDPLVCPECGSEQVQGSAWVWINSDEIADGDPPSNDLWCDDCESHPARVILRSEWLAEQAGEVA